jgi:hypothetical protein
MTTDAGLGILDRTVPLDRIDAEAKQVNFRRGALTFIAAVLVAIGWTAAKACRVTLTVLGAGLVAAGYTAAKLVLAGRAAAAWCAAAVKVGWQEGYGTGHGTAGRAAG